MGSNLRSTCDYSFDSLDLDRCDSLVRLENFVDPAGLGGIIGRERFLRIALAIRSTVGQIAIQNSRAAILRRWFPYIGLVIAC
jgi:hypothetical protein